MTRADAPVRGSTSRRDARREVWSPDPMGWHTRPLRRRYVDSRRRRHTPPPWVPSEGSAHPIIGASVHERRPDAPPTPSRRHAGALRQATAGMAHTPRQAPHDAATNTPPMHTGSMGRTSTSRLRTPTRRSLRRSGPPSTEARIQPPDAEGANTTVLSRGAGPPPLRPHEGRGVRYGGGIPPLIVPRDVRRRRSGPQDRCGPPVAPQGQEPKPEIEGAECQETLQTRCQTENPNSGGSQGGLNRRRKPHDGAGVSSPEPSGETCHPPDMDTPLAPGGTRLHGAAVGDSQIAEIRVRTVRWP